MEIIKTQGLTKLFNGNPGIMELHLQVESNAVFGLLGDDDSGKTTTLKLIAGLLYPEQGRVTVFEKEPFAERADIMAKTGCIIDGPGLFPYLNAEQHLLMYERLHPAIKREHGHKLLEQLGLYEDRWVRVKYYSMDMKQRLALVLALYHQPELLLLDEPAQSMDENQKALLYEVLQEHVNGGGTIFISSSLAQDMEQICTHVGIIDQGRLLESDSVASILKKYQSLEAYYKTVIPGQQEDEAVA